MSGNAPLQTGHVGLNVTDLGVSTRFYEEALGLVTIQVSEVGDRKFAFLGDGKNLLLTLWQQSGGRYRADVPGLHHLAFKVETQVDVARFERRLRDLGVRILHDGPVAHAEGANSGGIYFEDPDGIRLEVYAASGADALPAPSGSLPACGFF